MASVSRQQALKVALSVIGAEASPEMVVYSPTGALPRGAFVLEGGPDSAAGEHVTYRQSKQGLVISWTGRAKTLKAPAWMFWADLEPGAGFEHPSVLVLVSASSGAVVQRQDLAWWPVLDGRTPKFAGPAKPAAADEILEAPATAARLRPPARAPSALSLRASAFRSISSLIGSASGEPRARAVAAGLHRSPPCKGSEAVVAGLYRAPCTKPRKPTPPKPPSPVTPPSSFPAPWGSISLPRELTGAGALVPGLSLAHDCVIAAVNHSEFPFEPDYDDVRALAGKLGIPFAAAQTAAAIDAQMTAFEKKGCDDVLLYLSGHGAPAPGALSDSRPATSAKPIVTVGDSARILQSARASDGELDYGSSLLVLDSTSVLSALESHPKLKAKLVVDSCYSGRWTSLMDEDKVHGQIQVLTTSSDAKHESWDGKTNGQVWTPGVFTEALTVGIVGWATNASELHATNGTLAGGIADAFAKVFTNMTQALSNDGLPASQLTLLEGQNPQITTDLNGQIVPPHGLSPVTPSSGSTGTTTSKSTSEEMPEKPSEKGACPAQANIQTAAQDDGTVTLNTACTVNFAENEGTVTIPSGQSLTIEGTVSGSGEAEQRPRIEGRFVVKATARLTVHGVSISDSSWSGSNGQQGSEGREGEPGTPGKEGVNAVNRGAAGTNGEAAGSPGTDGEAGGKGGAGGNSGDGGSGGDGGGGGNGGAGEGGAIYNAGGKLSISQSTFTGDVAEGGYGGGGGQPGPNSFGGGGGPNGGYGGNGGQAANSSCTPLPSCTPPAGAEGGAGGNGGNGGNGSKAGSGGDAGNGGDAHGGAVYSTVALIANSQNTFADDAFNPQQGSELCESDPAWPTCPGQGYGLEGMGGEAGTQGFGGEGGYPGGAMGKKGVAGKAGTNGEAGTEGQEGEAGKGSCEDVAVGSPIVCET